MSDGSDAAAPAGAPIAWARYPPSGQRRGRGSPTGGVLSGKTLLPLLVGKVAGAAHRPVAGASGEPAVVPLGLRDTSWSPVAL
jgi:hypothetical protein